VDGEYRVVIDKLALVGNGTIGETVSARVQHAVGLEEAAVIDLVAFRVLHRELGPGFVKVAYFGDEGVADVLVLDRRRRLLRCQRGRG
jgi:hypothetical protein